MHWINDYAQLKFYEEIAGYIFAGVVLTVWLAVVLYQWIKEHFKK